MDDDYSSTYSSYYSSYYRPRSPPKTPPRPDPITRYDLKFVKGGSSSGGKCMYVSLLFGFYLVYPLLRRCSWRSDLVFVLDCTGSMQKYINATRDHVFGICDMIRGEEGLGGPDDLRVAVRQAVSSPFDGSGICCCR